ncbi:MAG: sulfatase-like hydrolase/transferase [Acidobacteria bacterium]|nr:sulfatase-like hydrolase/transferase [Acidobacteriota bacterium]
MRQAPAALASGRVLAAGLVLAALAAGTACGRSGSRPAPAATAERPSVLIVVVDALRADRVGAYGYPLETTPTIDQIAADPDAVLFRHHYVQGTWTKTSTASLFTGLFAFQHGVMEGHEPAEEGQERFFTTQVLDGSFETMAERLKGVGFTTFGVSKSHHLRPEYGFAQGFEEYFGPKEASSEGKRVDRVLEIVSRAEPPFFGYLHLAGPHHPYPPSSRDEAFMQRHGFAYDEKARIAAGVNFHTHEVKDRINTGGLRLTPDDARFLNLVYDAATRRVDEKFVSELVSGLKRLGVYDNTLLIVTADHGEELYDHAGYAHGHALWEEVIHVPLIVKFPRGRRPPGLPREVEFVTRAIDVYPSILAFAGQRIPPELPGENLFDGTGPRFALSERKGEWALITDGYKLIEAASGPLLFELAKDPGEQTNLAPVEVERLALLRLVTDGIRHDVVLQPREADWIGTELDREDVEALKGLGYMR